VAKAAKGKKKKGGKKKIECLEALHHSHFSDF